MEWRELPDPVVAAYMQELLAVSSAHRDRVIMPLLESLRYTPLREIPRRLFTFVLDRINAWSFRRIATAGCTDITLLRSYDSFFAVLRAKGWSGNALTLAAIGLYAVRYRAIDPTGAIATYSSQLEDLAPRRRIGWDAPTA